MRACMVGYAFYETDNRIRRYAEALVRRGDEVDAIVLQREGQVPFEIIKGVRVYRIQKRVRDEKGPFSYLRKVLMFLFRSTWALTVQHLKARYDVIHVHSVPDFEVFATIVPKLMGARVILDIHDIVPEFYASKFKVEERSLVFRLLLLLERLSIAYSDHVIISNHLWHSKLTQRSVRPEKCTAIINYPDLSIFSRRPRCSPSNGNFVICYPGTLNWHQGVDLAISAMGLVRLKAPHCKFVIIGDGPDREKLKLMIRLRRLENCVTMTGLVPLEQVAEKMANIDLGLVPKRNDSFGDEAFSTKIMEFMAMGVPVVVSKTRIDQHYFNEQLVQFVEPGSAEDLAAKILDLAHDPEKCRVLREQGIDFIEKNNWDVRKHEYLDLVDGLLKRHSVGHSAVKSLSLK
jgi:glycosyltransferase involved in cell wall biosynthesis